jgi:ribose 5-phosphate isomerase A
MSHGLSPSELSPSDLAKRAAAARALDLIDDGMIVGLGTGSTAAWFVRVLSERIKSGGLAITGVATSDTTSWLARELGIPLKTLDQAGRIDLTVDGADEFDTSLNLIKGGGAALLKEKIVATASDRMVVIADLSKRVETLGAFSLPVEVVRFGCTVTKSAVERVLADQDVDGRETSIRMSSDKPLVTDEGHHILDLHLGRIGDPQRLAQALNMVPGVVEHGLFVGVASAVVLGHEDGTTEFVRRDAPPDTDELMRNEDA